MPVLWAPYFWAVQPTGRAGKRRAVFGCRRVPEALELVLLAQAAPLQAHMPASPSGALLFMQDADSPPPPPCSTSQLPSQSVNRMRAISVQELSLGKNRVEMGAEGIYPEKSFSCPPKFLNSNSSLFFFFFLMLIFLSPVPLLFSYLCF